MSDEQGYTAVPKFMVAVIGTTAMVVCGFAARAAAPVVTGWSSVGGHTGKKDNDQDTMYLVQPGDAIRFGVDVEGARSYHWQLNKQVQTQACAASFCWTVPDEKGIWEIHAVATNDGGEAHREWIVSTLPAEEAPDIFDYFCDGRYYDRVQTDPWGRPLPEWREAERNGAVRAKPAGMYDASARWLDKRLGQEGYIFLPSGAAYGTWKIRYRDSLDYCFVGNMPDDRVEYGPGQYIYDHAGTGTYAGHMWFRGVLPREFFPPERYPVRYLSYGYPSRYSLAWSRGIAMYGSSLGRVPGWVELKIIRTPDGAFYHFLNGRAMLGMFAIDNTFKECQFIRTGSETIDCVEVYRNRYLFPAKSAHYQDYLSQNEKQTQVALSVATKKGIVVQGRDVRLADIAHLLGDRSLFRYDDATRTGTCYTNLVISGGAELVVDGETLRMHCDGDGEHEIRIMQGATLKALNSTITTDTGHYYLWRFSSPYESENYAVGGTRGGFFDARCVVIVKNSTIDNCGCFYLQSPTGVVLDGARFANLVDVGGRKAKAYQWRDAPGADAKVGFWYLERSPTVPLRTFRRLQFEGKGPEPASVVFDGGDPFGPISIYDSVFKNVVVRARYFRKICGAGPKQDWEGLWAVPETSRTLNLVNCRFDELDAATKFAWINVKYYLDVQVVDRQGRPVPGAVVRAINEVDDELHPAENLQTGWKWSSTYAEGYGNHLVPYRKWTEPQPLRQTRTGTEGRTPPPSDQAHSLVVTDYTVQNPLDGDKLELVWETRSRGWAMELNVFARQMGRILRLRKENLPYEVLNPGDTHHATLQYDADRHRLRLTVTHAGGATIWDTGWLQIISQDRSRVLRPGFLLDRILYRVAHQRRGERIRWDPAGHIYLYGPPYSQGGYLKAAVDNMKLTVAGKPAYDEDYASDPGMKAVTEDAEEYHRLPASVAGQSFTWRFDFTCQETNRKYWGMAAIALAGEAGPNRQYRYTIEVTGPDGTAKKITGVDPGPHWYRPDPASPAYTIVAVLDGKAVTELELEAQGSAGPTKRNEEPGR